MEKPPAFFEIEFGASRKGPETYEVQCRFGLAGKRGLLWAVMDGPSPLRPSIEPAKNEVERIILAGFKEPRSRGGMPIASHHCRAGTSSGAAPDERPPALRLR